MGRKLGSCVPLGEGELGPIKHKVAWAEAYLHTKWHRSPSNRLATTNKPKIGGAVPL